MKKVLFSFLKANADIIVLVGILLSVFSLCASMVVAFGGFELTHEQREFILSCGLLVFFVGGVAPLLWDNSNN